jgi:hypothetical protein
LRHPTQLLATAAVLAVVAAATPLAAQPIDARRDTLRDTRNFSFYARGPFRAAVPRPEAILGYELGEQNTQYAQQERVLLAIADAARERVRVGDRADARGAAHCGSRRVGRRTSRGWTRSGATWTASPTRAARRRRSWTRAVARTPAVVWISESVHGNESPGFESGMQLLYQLAASDEPAHGRRAADAVLLLTRAPTRTATSASPSWYNSVARRDPGDRQLRARQPWSIQGGYTTTAST